MTSQRPLAVLLAALCLGLAACGGDDDPEPDAGTTTTERTTGPSAQERLARANLQLAIRFYNEGYEEFLGNFRRATRRGDFEQVKAALAEYRDVFYEFDAKLRAIEFDEELVAQVNGILQQNRDLIAKLDRIGRTRDLDEAVPIYEEFLQNRRTAVKAINRLAGEL
jgi:hypothetical protein